MINLCDIASKDLAKILKLLRQKEVLEAEMMMVMRDAEKRDRSSAGVRAMRRPRKAQPVLRDVIVGILAAAKKPMTVAEIYKASVATGYLWESKEPINALNVKMYTDKTFKKVAPGKFVVRKKG